MFPFKDGGEGREGGRKRREGVGKEGRREGGREEQAHKKGCFFVA